MHSTHVRNQFYLHWRKVVFFFILLGSSVSSFGQGSTKASENLLHYHDRWVHYGFMLGIHSSKYVMRYSDTFVKKLDSVHSIVPGNSGGFKIGFLVNMKLMNKLDLRSSITVGFYENSINYRYTDLTNRIELKEATTLELPVLLKYRSERRGNIGMYLLAGINPKLDVRNKQESDLKEKLETHRFDLAIDVGVGLDMYFKLFKFSPEIRYSYGLTNILANNTNSLGVGLQTLNNQNLGLFITFEGSPTDAKRSTSRTKGSKQRMLKKRKKILKKHRQRN